MKRFKLRGASDKRRFSRTADQTHVKNVSRSASVMRGGFRI